MIAYNLEGDYSLLWMKRECHVDGLPMRLLKWTPDFDVLHESSIALVWVRFPELPPHLYNHKALYILGQFLGKLLKLDEHTKDHLRLINARMCIEVDLTASIPTKINLVQDSVLTKV